MLSLRKKLLVSVFTLLIAVVAVATTTYAWFTMGNTTNVSNIGMGVQTTEGLMIRVNSINGVATENHATYDRLYDWSTAVNLNNILTSTNTKLKPVSMGARLSNAGTQATDTNALYTLVTTPSDGLVYSAAQTGDYIAIEFEFYSMSALHVHFDAITSTPVGTYTFKTPVQYTGSDDFDGITYNKDDIISNARLANAIRVATTVGGGTDYTIINPAVYDAEKLQYGTWGGAAVSFFNATTSADYPLPSVTAEYTYGITTTTLTSTTLVTLTGDEINGYTGSVRILVWLEGWDADCFNPIILDTANLSFQFTGVEVTTSTPTV